jgi:hypothetical protein
LSVEDHTLLDLFDILLIKYVFTYGKFLNAEIGAESIADGSTAFLRNSTIENFQFHDGFVVFDQGSHS